MFFDLCVMLVINGRDKINSQIRVETKFPLGVVTEKKIPNILSVLKIVNVKTMKPDSVVPTMVNIIC